MLKNKRTYLIPSIGFATIILVSAFLLCLPICNYKEISYGEALFTATSGLTTTGFTRMPIINQFNFLGQLILAILMEIGALGFIIFVSYFWSIKNKKIKMSDIMLINDNISSDNYAMIKEQSIFIGKLMLKIQLIGIILLAIKFIPLYGFLKGIWFSIFHTISAFSNTGFDLFGSNSLLNFSKDFYVQLVLIALMVIGGIGMLVIQDVKNNKTKKFSRLRLQSKIILTMTAIIIIIPTILMKIFEPNLSLLNCLFMTTTSRSTGFSIVDLKSLCFENKMILMILMFIGGAPTSTAGGVKIVPITIICATVISTLRGRNDTIIFGRKIPDTAIKKSFTIFIVFAIILFVSCMIFVHFEDVSILNIIFDSISAISNTGLAMTNMNAINITGELVLMFLMFVGRVGPISMVLIFVNADNKDKYIEYPSENVIL